MPLLRFVLMFLALSCAAMPGAAFAQARTIAYGNDPAQFGTLHLPSGAGPFPVAVLIHGRHEAADTPAPSVMEPLADALAERGIASWDIEYRAMGEEGPACADIGAAVDYLPALAREYPLDLHRVTLIGHRDGATYAFLMAGRRPAPDAPAPRPMSVVGLDGPDASAAGCAQGAMETAPALAALLPLGIRQLLVVGSREETVARYADAARAAGDWVAVMRPGGADDTNILAPQSPQGRDVLSFLIDQAIPAAPDAGSARADLTDSGE